MQIKVKSCESVWGAARSAQCLKQRTPGLVVESQIWKRQLENKSSENFECYGVRLYSVDSRKLVDILEEGRNVI